jgi:metallo-beta-lactamase class B
MNVPACLIAVWLVLTAAPAWSQKPASPMPPCKDCATWNQAQEPFLIYGNTYYVGPHGLSAILITSPAGHILIDSALPESVPQIVAHIRSLGFRIEDVKLILNSHAHFDHAGGISELQQLSGATVAVSPWSADVFTKSGVARDDPQFGEIRPIALVKHVRTIRDGEVLRVGSLALTAHFTPGHTPGGSSWTWQSCQNGKCLNLVYSDSMSPVSGHFRFSDSPGVQQEFARSFAFLRAVPCDILLTPHPDASGLWTRLPDRLVNPKACQELADRASEQLSRRIETEKKH